MILSRYMIFTLVGLGAIPSACVAQHSIDEIYSFGQEETSGEWRGVPASDLASYLNASKVTCSTKKAEIDVVWNSESGDWAAFDHYSSDGSFFQRTIRFAQFDQAVEIVKNRPDSEPRMTFGGDEVAQYDFLLEELTIWTNANALPFQLPACALRVFQSN